MCILHELYLKLVVSGKLLESPISGNGRKPVHGSGQSTASIWY